MFELVKNRTILSETKLLVFTHVIFFDKHKAIKSRFKNYFLKPQQN